MARASVETLLPLDRFAYYFGINPIHFNQVEIANLSTSRVCDSPLIQHPWQDADRASREEIAQAIADAETLISQAVGFKLAPTWEVNDSIKYLRPARAELIASGIADIRGFNTGINTNWKKVHSGGVKGLTTLQLASPIVYTDTNLDGYFETATMTVATTVTDPEEIRVFYPGTGGDSTYEIRPTTVTISGGVATITCKRELLVNLNLQEDFNASGVEGTVDANFLSTVDIYRVYNDPSYNGYFSWLNKGTCGVCTACTKTYQYVCLSVDDSENGLVRVEPAEWDAVNLEYDATSLVACRAPDEAKLWYKAGWKYRTHTFLMDPIWERAICYFAAAQLHRPLCGCQSVTNYIEYWQEDLSSRVSSPSGSLSYRHDSKLFNNPFGTRRGHIYAWRLAQKYIGGGVNA